VFPENFNEAIKVTRRFRCAILSGYVKKAKDRFPKFTLPFTSNNYGLQRPFIQNWKPYSCLREEDAMSYQADWIFIAYRKKF
jgi:hypothetical protein